MSVFSWKNPSKAHVFTVLTLCDLRQQSRDSSQFPYYPTCSTYGNNEVGAGVHGWVNLEESGKKMWFPLKRHRKTSKTERLFSQIPRSLLTGSSAQQSIKQLNERSLVLQWHKLFPNMNKFSHRLKGLNHHRETAHLCSNHPNLTNNPELCPDCLTHSAN